MKNPYRNLVAVAAVTALLGTGVAIEWKTNEAQASPNGGTPAALVGDSISDVAEGAVDSIVTVQVTSNAGGFRTDDPLFTDPASPLYGQGDQQKVGGLGSGVVVSASGRILTNAHVVQGADDITVALDDGNEYDAKVVGIDPKTDVAVIQLEGKFPTLKPIKFGDSSQLRLGEVVLAIGNPLGVGKSVTMGIVSAKGRGGRGIVGYADFIQTDAAINQGNSGGALVNMKGELVGINTAIISRSGGYQGIGYAIPTNMAKPIMEMLVKDGKVVRGYLGVNIQTVTGKLAKQYKLGASTGALVASVMPGTPAAKAGLAEGDVITALNGASVKSSEALMNSIAMMRPGSEVALDVAGRDQSVKTIKAKLGELPTN